MLFDADGVLVDSYAAYRTVWDRWAARQGLDSDVVWAATHARRPTETIAETAPTLDPVEEYAILKTLLADEEDRTGLFAGVADLLHDLPPRQWAVVTSGRAAVVRARLRRGGAPKSRRWSSTDRQLNTGSPVPSAIWSRQSA